MAHGVQPPAVRAPAVGGEAMKARGPGFEWDQVSCMRCGARDFEVTGPGWAEERRDWLRLGGLWRPARQILPRVPGT
jgi:hypothetical protein